MTRFRDRYRYTMNPPPKPGDAWAMKNAIERLTATTIPYVRTNEITIKISEYNFCPNAGTIWRDGGKALPQRGVEALIRLVRKDIDEDLARFEFLLEKQK